MKQPNFLVIGHVTVDVTVDGSSFPGGAAYYASQTAASLGKRVALLTRGARWVSVLFSGMDVTVVDIYSEATTKFENIYQGKNRTQRIDSLALPIRATSLPNEWKECPVVLLAPVYREVTEGFIPLFENSLVGLCPQGWMRDRGEGGWVKPMEWRGDSFLKMAEVMILSEDDLPAKQIPESWFHWNGILIVTQGEQGAVGRWDGQWHRIPAHPVSEEHPTGAGDVFAAAFLVRYSETRDPAESALFASAAASIKVEHQGLGGIPTREQVQERRAAHPELRVTPCEKPF